jgi:hypothetical protein
VLLGMAINSGDLQATLIGGLVDTARGSAAIQINQIGARTSSQNDTHHAKDSDAYGTCFPIHEKMRPSPP